MVEHKQLPVTLDSYELDEEDIRMGREKRSSKVIRITIRGKNIVMRALEPTIRIGDVIVSYPQIQTDEKTITGYLTEVPKEGSPIVLEYSDTSKDGGMYTLERGKQPGTVLKEPFTLTKLKRVT